MRPLCPIWAERPMSCFFLPMLHRRNRRGRSDIWCAPRLRLRTLFFYCFSNPLIWLIKNEGKKAQMNGFSVTPDGKRVCLCSKSAQVIFHGGMKTSENDASLGCYKMMRFFSATSEKLLARCSSNSFAARYERAEQRHSHFGIGEHRPKIR